MGLTLNSWQGEQGEYWVLAQAALGLELIVLPVYRPFAVIPSPRQQYGIWVVAAAIGLVALSLVTKGLLDLGHNLIPLPDPEDDAQLVHGVYGIVRHPLYSELVLAAIGWALYQISLSHWAGAIICFEFLMPRQAAKKFG